MSTSTMISRGVFSVARMRSGIYLGLRALGAYPGHRKCITIRSQLLSAPCAPFHTATVFSSTPSITVTEEPDTLFQKVSVLVKGHDKAVLNSYEFFATMAAKELGIKVTKVYEPSRVIERFTLLKSVHIFKKHRVQYEMRTHYRCIELSHLTGSTTQVYLEYIQRNLPEGVAMEVTKTAMEKVPEHILEPMWKDHPIADTPGQ
ncbi:probable 28S ribosomal protein S10, mitochondrial [Thalassophryne amazonica]|uniref:probable 28S ribosomal protein S10, mitochondrial n=1 Tax=Thalassophryne amazonica TaxID=390379 RepID=UPI0014714517|nr:probable 28S ribosomal protein S10, mitochondrial [Thalassophryne amazonica]